MDKYLNLSQAADLLAELTYNPRIKDDIVRIIMLGADGEIPIFWRNSLHVWTRISSQVELLPREELEPLAGTEAAPSWLQIPQMVLCDLEIDQQTQCWTFEIDEEDCYSFMAKGEALCTDFGLVKWFRHPVDLEDVTIRRSQLFVVERHLRKYADDLSPTKMPKGADVGHVPSRPQAPDGPVVIAKPPAVGDDQIQKTGTDTGQSSDGGNQSAAAKLQWWESAYKIKEMAKNIGDVLHDKKEKLPNKGKNATSNHKIAKQIHIRIVDIERSKGLSRKVPSWDTIRGRLKGWKFTPNK